MTRISNSSLENHCAEPPFKLDDSESVNHKSPETVACQSSKNGKNIGKTAPVPLIDSICQSTTFVQDEVGGTPEYSYSRVGNPTVSTLETTLGQLEAAPPSVCFASGLAAETALFLGLLRSGDHVVLSKAIYGGTVRLIRDLLSGLGIEFTFVDTTDTRNVCSSIIGTTRLVFIETPANPTLCLTDIAAIAKATREANVLLAVDNTFLTPVLQRPLDLGADISVYSTTKHIEGHSSALGGAITSRNDEVLDRVRWIRKSTGAIQSPHNAWLTTRGIKTLPIRLERHSKNAHEIASALAVNDHVNKVNYPGLIEFPQYDLARKQHRGGHGGVISFELEGGFERATRFLRNIRSCSLVEHVGSVDTLLTHPASMTHADVPKDQLADVGLSPGLLRLSVGLENPQEILDDLNQAIELSALSTGRFASTNQNSNLEGGLKCAIL